MRALRVSLAGTVILALLGGPSGAALAQDESDAPLAGESAQLSFPTGHGKTIERPATDHEAGRGTYRDHLIIGPIDANDPRLGGDQWVIYNYDILDDTGLQITSAVGGIRNEDGSWRGTVSGYATQGEAELYLLWDLIGEGGYEGLSARVFWVPEGGDFTVEGLIFEGEPPPFPDDARVAVVASMGIEAGDPIVAWGAALEVVPATEAGPDAYVNLDDVINRVAAVAIEEGQPITPDMLEPLPEE